MTNYIANNEGTKFFLRIQRWGENISVMSFHPILGLAEAGAEFAKYKKAFDDSYAVWEARPDVDDLGVPKGRAPTFDGTDPLAIVLSSADAAKAIDPANLANDDNVPGKFFAGKDIGAPDGYWGSVQWDTYFHGSNKYAPGERKGRQQWLISMDSNGYVFAPYNRLAIVATNNDLVGRDIARLDYQPVLTVTPKFPDSTLDDCTIVLHANVDRYWTNIPNLVTIDGPMPSTGFYDDKTPRISIKVPDTIAPDTKINVEIDLTLNGKPITDKTLTVNLSADAGYLSRTRFDVGGGNKFIPFRSTDLEDGMHVTFTASFDNDPVPVSKTVLIST